MDELTTMGVGSAMGFVFKTIAESRKSKDQQFQHLMALNDQGGKLANLADKRGGSMGAVVRRFIVVVVLAGLVILPFLASLMDMPTVVETQKEGGSLLFGLIKGRTTQVYQDVQGYLIVNELRPAILAIISFYFGLASAK